MRVEAGRVREKLARCYLDEGTGDPFEIRLPVGGHPRHLDASADAVMDARDRIAADRGLWLLDGVRPAEVPGWSTTEIYIGDASLAIDDARLVPAFVELVRSARGA